MLVHLLFFANTESHNLTGLKKAVVAASCVSRSRFRRSSRPSARECGVELVDSVATPASFQGRSKELLLKRTMEGEGNRMSSFRYPSDKKFSRWRKKIGYEKISKPASVGVLVLAAVTVGGTLSSFYRPTITQCQLKQSQELQVVRLLFLAKEETAGCSLWNRRARANKLSRNGRGGGDPESSISRITGATTAWQRTSLT